MSDFATELIEGERSGKYSPVEVAQWLEEYANRGEKSLMQAGKLESLEFRRLAIDVDMQVGLGRFFAAKFRSGVLYRLHEQSGDRTALEECLKTYRAARAAWAEIAERAGASSLIGSSRRLVHAVHDWSDLSARIAGQGEIRARDLQSLARPV